MGTLTVVIGENYGLETGKALEDLLRQELVKFFPDGDIQFKPMPFDPEEGIADIFARIEISGVEIDEAAQKTCKECLNQILYDWVLEHPFRSGYTPNKEESRCSFCHPC